MTDIIEEISQDQSDERKLYFFKKVLPVILVATFAIIIFMVIRDKQQQKIDGKNIELSHLLVTSINIEDAREAEKLLETIIKSGKDSRIIELAQLRMAGLKIKQQDLKSAEKILQDIMRNGQYLSISRSFARIAWLGIKIDEVDLGREEKEQILQCLNYFKDQNQEFFVEAHVLKALWYKKNDQLDLARAALQHISNIENLPQILQEQIKALISEADAKH
ncbi:MAG: tetratricopeptide repeat protein [Rickettsiaceae bacterium]|nr:MAG: tetratricopeptide repeat protein [Rickettsiaceae bacterium]